MGITLHMIACYLVEWVWLSQQKKVAEKPQKGLLSLQIEHEDLLFTDFIITDITSGQKNCVFAEITFTHFTHYYNTVQVINYKLKQKC